MALHHSRDGYTFSADAESLIIEPGPKPITLNRAELERLGLAIRDDYNIQLDTGPTGPDLVDAILSALNEAAKRCRGPEESWMAMNLRRAVVLIGGMDEKVAQEILDQEGI